MCPVHHALYSDNGVDWFPASAPDGTFANAQIHSAAAYGSGFVAAGALVEPEAGTVNGAIWISDDGSEWRLVNSGVDAGKLASICEGVGRYVFGGFEHVVVVNASVFAVGQSLVRSCPHKWDVIALRSDDLSVWSDASVPDFPDVVSGGDQFLLARTQPPTVWRSSDAVAWAESRLTGPRRSGVQLLMPLSDRYVALGGETFDPPYTQLTWSSPDGERWELVSEVELARGTRPLHQAVVLGDEIVAAGVFGTEPGPFDGEVGIAGITTSSDGIEWTRPELGPFIATQITTLVTNGSSVLVVGQGSSVGALRLWVGTPSR